MTHSTAHAATEQQELVQLACTAIMAALFGDLCIYIVSYRDVEASQTAALVAKLQENGAAVSKRFSDRVTHVVVQRTHAPSDADRTEGEARLRDVFQRVDQVCGVQQGLS